MAQKKQKGRYRRRTVTPSQARTAIKFLRRALAGKRHQRKATAEILGCSNRTASRILSESKPYNCKMTLDWVYRICAYAGRPISDVIEPNNPTFGESLAGWAGLTAKSEAFVAAHELALAVSWRSYFEYGFACTSLIESQDGYPEKVLIAFCSPLDFEDLKKPWEDKKHVLTVTVDMSGLDHIMWLKYRGDFKYSGYSGPLTVLRLQQIFAHAFKSSKNIATDVVKQFARRPADA